MVRKILISKEDLEQIKDFENEGGYPVEIVYVVIEPADEPRMPPEEKLMMAA